MIGRQLYFGRIMNGLVRPIADLAFMTDREIEHSKEGLTRLSISPMSLIAGFIPEILFVNLQVVVGLAVVCAVVSLLLH